MHLLIQANIESEDLKGKNQNDTCDTLRYINLIIKNFYIK